MTQENNNKAVTVAQQAQAVSSFSPSDMDMAKALVASHFFPNIQSASQALVKIQLGRELGFGPVSSMIGVHVWTDKRGRTTVQLGANLVANLVRKSGIYDFQVLNDKEHPFNEQQCIIRFFRQGKAIGESRFTMADAKRAGLIREGSQWEGAPRNMLFAAAMRNGAKWFCSEVLLGSAIPLSEREPSADVDAGETHEEDSFEGHLVTTEVGETVDEETGELVEDIPVVSAPPEGYGVPWPEFWKKAREVRKLSPPQAHRMFIPQDEGESDDDYFARTAADGTLADWVARQAQETGKGEAEIVAEMIAALDTLPTPPPAQGQMRANWK